MPSKVKPASIRKVINEAIEVLQALGVPLASATPRSREMAAMSFLSVAGVTHSADWPSAGLHPGPPLRSREIIEFINKHFKEEISPGSYDDIRRKHLKGAVVAGVVVPSSSKPSAALNDPTRGYGINPEHGTVIRAFGSSGWATMAAKFMESRPKVLDAHARRLVEASPLVMPDGTELRLGPGKHNALQRAVVEQFRPRFAPGAHVLYLGDADDRRLYAQEERISSVNIDLDAAGSLPDIILLDDARKWVFLIEAVHSYGPISESRLLDLRRLCKDCPLPLVFVTAFLDRNTFRSSAPKIAWETEVWIADQPDHMIHFNGDRFLGPRTADDHSSGGTDLPA